MEVGKIFYIAERCKHLKYPTNTIVIRQGDLPKHVFFVKSGKMKLIRKVDFRNSLETLVPKKEMIKILSQDLTKEEVESKNFHSKLLEIDTLLNGDWFGVQEALVGGEMSHSVITSIPTEVFILDAAEFIRLGQEIMENFFRYNKFYPNDQAIRESFLEMKRWEDYKERVSLNVRCEKELERRKGHEIGRKDQIIPPKFSQPRE